MFTRKSLFVALTVVAMLAMLVPMASAAPEWVHKVEITKPTTAAPLWLKYDAVQKFDVSFTTTWAGTLVQPIYASVVVLDQYNNVVSNGGWNIDQYLVSDVPADGKLKQTVNLPLGLSDGWYNIQVCVVDSLNWWGDPGTAFACAVQKNALVLDATAPIVMLEKPDWGSFITGKAYELVAGAGDNLKLDKVEFFVKYGGGPNAEWVSLGEGTPNGVTDTFSLVWDSSNIPDGPVSIKVEATDHVGHVSADVHSNIWVENGYTIHLEPGWNLISSPLMLYNEDVKDVLGHLVDLYGNPLWDSIYAMDNTNAGEPDVYKWHMAKPAGVGDLAKIEDGKGYWIHMLSEGNLWFRGTWLNIGPQQPPEYQAFEGWNLIGYTHWGNSTSLPAKSRMQYLKADVDASVEVMYRYDASDGHYYQVASAQPMEKGAGYWLALMDSGTINP